MSGNRWGERASPGAKWNGHPYNVWVDKRSVWLKKITHSGVAMAEQTHTNRAAAVSAWAPLRHPAYRALWIATLASNLGSWMQDMGAAWLMTTLTPSPVLIALVQAATSLPVFFLALPAGALADIGERRRVLLLSQYMGVSLRSRADIFHPGGNNLACDSPRADVLGWNRSDARGPRAAGGRHRTGQSRGIAGRSGAGQRRL